MAPDGKITLYLDIISPFGYIAYHHLRNNAAFNNVEISYVPILLGGLMKMCNNRPPIEIKNKDKWISREVGLISRRLSVPKLRFPSTFPQPTVNAQRALCAIALHSPAQLPAAYDALFASFWSDNQAVNDPQVIVDVLSKALEGGKAQAEELVGRRGEADVKELLTGNTKKAFEDGAFGMPWFVVENKRGEKMTAWGADRIGMVAEFLGIERPEGTRALL